MALPYLAGTKYVLDGKMTTRRTARMAREARFLYRVRDGGSPSHPRLVQGGWSGAVSQSAGTHLRDAMDDGLASVNAAHRLLWQRVNWEVGFAGWIRTPLPRVWGWHFHKLPKGGWLSSAAAQQIVRWNQGRDALAQNRAYPAINASGLKGRTWEQHLKRLGRDVRTNEPALTVDLSGVQGAFKTGKRQDKAQDVGDNDIQQIQDHLNFFLGRHLTLDGIPGPVTKSAYADFQARVYGVKKWSSDANGIPGKSSLWNLSFKVVA